MKKIDLFIGAIFVCSAAIFAWTYLKPARADRVGVPAVEEAAMQEAASRNAAGWEAFAGGDYKKALSEFQAAREAAAGTEAFSLQGLACSYYQLGDKKATEKTLASLQKALQGNNTSSFAEAWVAALNGCGRAGEAQEQAKSLVKTYPESVRLWATLADASLYLNDLQGAAEALQAANKFTPDETLSAYLADLQERLSSHADKSSDGTDR